MGSSIQPGEVRPSDTFRQKVVLLYGSIKAVEMGRAFDDSVAIVALGHVLNEGMKKTTSASGVLDLHGIAAHVITMMSMNQCKDTPRPTMERVWGNVLRGEAVAPAGLREHIGERATVHAIENENAIRALADLLDRGLTETTRGTGAIELERLAAWLLREMRGTKC